MSERRAIVIPEERKRVLYVLIAARTDAKARGAMFNMYDEAIAIMRKEQEPPPGELCPACAAAEFERVSGFGELK